MRNTLRETDRYYVTMSAILCICVFETLPVTSSNSCTLLYSCHEVQRNPPSLTSLDASIVCIQYTYKQIASQRKACMCTRTCACMRTHTCACTHSCESLVWISMNIQQRQASSLFSQHRRQHLPKPTQGDCVCICASVGFAKSYFVSTCEIMHMHLCMCMLFYEQDSFPKCETWLTRSFVLSLFSQSLPCSLLAQYCNAVITLSVRFMEWLTLAMMLMQTVGEGARLTLHSMVPLNTTINTWLKK